MKKTVKLFVILSSTLSIVCSPVSLLIAYATPVNCSLGKTLNVVAHADDDLLFINPKIKQDINAGKCVETVYVTAGDGGGGFTGSLPRENGVRAAYAQMAGATNSWTTTSVTINSHVLSETTLVANPKIKLTFMRLPDGDGNGAGFSANSNQSLAKLWYKTISTINPIDGSASYTKQQLLDVFHRIMASFLPDTIRTLNFANDYDGGATDHSDHRMVGHFVKEANANYTVPHQLIGYKGYDIEPMAANVTGTDYSNKQNAFLAYAGCQSISDCVPPAYVNYFGRNYVTDAGIETRTVSAFETMDGSSTSLSGISGTIGKTPTAIEFGGKLYSFYYDQTNGELRYSKASSSTSPVWSSGVLDTYGTNVGQDPTAVVFNSKLYLFYYDVANGNLREADTANGTTWQFNNIDTVGNVGLTPTAIVYGGVLRVFYYDQTNGDLKQASLNGSIWSPITLDGSASSITTYSADLGRNPTVTEYSGTLQVYSYDATHGDLHHTWYQNSNWYQETLDGNTTADNRVNGDVGMNPTVTNYNGVLQLFYYDATHGDLRHDWNDNNGWHFENLEGDEGSITRHDGNVGATPYVIVQGTVLHVFARDVDKNDLRHYWSSPSQGGWQVEDLDGSGDDGSAGRTNSSTGEDPAAAVYGTKLHVFYYDATDTNLRHATL